MAATGAPHIDSAPTGPKLRATAPGAGGLVSLEAGLALLVAMSPLRWISVWAWRAEGSIGCVTGAGEPHGPRAGRELALRLLSGGREGPRDRRVLLGMALGAQDRPLGALVARAEGASRERGRAALQGAAPVLEQLLRRDMTAIEQMAGERALALSAERRLMRVGLDLHDGPLQALAALGGDVRLFAEQLELALGAHPSRELLQGRVEDLQAQLGALDGDVRRIAGEARFGARGSRRNLRGALGEVVRSFSRQSGVPARLEVQGSLAGATDSQQLALLNIVAEALSNVRRHAGASSVTVTVLAQEGAIEATVSDDGSGFDATSRPSRALREGRAGLVAMSERARLLGGRCTIESRRGGPTAVRVVLPRWRAASGGGGKSSRLRRRLR